MKRTPFVIACFIVIVAALFGGCATNDWTKGPPQKANPTAPDLREEVDNTDAAVNRPPWAK